MNSFDVKAREGSYAIAYDGQVIAELQHQGDWEQTSGEPLDEDVYESIKQAIEAKFK